jgi:NitT/TauT family transport system ATP-binding protein
MTVASTNAPVRTASTAARGVAIQVDGVVHVFRTQTEPARALECIDLSIAEGTFVAVLGPSGCGKTTLLRIMSGLLEPSEGRVLLAGEPPSAARRRRAIGWLAQEDGLLPWQSVLDNVSLPLRLARARDPHVELEMLRRVGLATSARRYPHELSGGMRQRVALARALVARPPFLLLDEPFAHLDELTRERLGDLLVDLRAEGVRQPTTVLVTHSVLEAVRLADRVVVLSGSPGRVVDDVDIRRPRPRHEDEVGFGGLVRRLKTSLLQPLTKI